MRKREKDWGIWARSAILCCIVIICSSICSGISLEMKGHLRVWYAAIADNTNHTQYEEDFAVNLDSGRDMWRIDNLSKNSASDSSFTFHDYVVIERNTHPPLPYKHFIASSYVDGGYPIDLDQDQRTVWLVYCSSKFLKTHGDKSVILPDQPARYVPKIYGCAAHMQWRNTNDLCPAQIDFVFQKDLMKDFTTNLSFEAEGDFLRQRANLLDAYLAWVTNGTLRAKFEVLEWTNVAEVGTPIRWTVSYFQDQDPAPYRIFYGQTTSVTNGTDFAPSFPEIIQLEDSRVHAIAALNSVDYLVTNGNIPNLNDAYVRNKIARLSGRMLSPEPRGTTSRRLVILLGFVVLIVLPPIIMLMRRHPKPIN